MSDPRDHLNRYVENVGSLVEAASRLGLPYVTLAKIVNGTRGISPKMASRMASADPLLSADVLVWVRANRTETKQEQKTAA